mmetsp:Transcript_24200/g.67292  ORF Transcript_24200/g.67292 Transcript_24200/m.67292 type:complete len:425 (-) Transcript_24200:276-1550(-)
MEKASGLQGRLLWVALACLLHLPGLLSKEGGNCHDSGAACAPRIYVYRLPKHLNPGPNRRCELSQFAAESVILESVKELASIVEEPEDADFFWVPASVMCRGGQATNTTTGAYILRDVVAYLRASGPFFDAHGGKDHIFTYMVQASTCTHPALAIPELRNAVILTHWTIRHSTLTCTLPGNHLVVPTPFHDKYTGVDADIAQKDKHRSIHVLAVGVPETTAVVSDSERNMTTFLSAIKYRTANLLHGKYKGHVMQRAEWAPTHYPQYFSSQFCLVTLNSLGIQMKLASQAGCIPIFISEEAMPWDHLLPYDMFSLSLPLDSLFRLPFDVTSLRVKTDKMNEMRRVMSCMSRFMGWRHKKGLAAKLLLCDLRMRKEPSVHLHIDIAACEITCEPDGWGTEQRLETSWQPAAERTLPDLSVDTGEV